MGDVPQAKSSFSGKAARATIVDKHQESVPNNLDTTNRALATVVACSKSSCCMDVAPYGQTFQPDASLTLMRHMKKRQSQYPIGQLILEELEKSERVSDFLRDLGYQNITKGVRRLDECLAGHIQESFLERFKRRYHHRLTEILAAQEKTQTILRYEAEVARAKAREQRRLAFRPYVQATTERKAPSSFTFYAITGGPVRETIVLKGLDPFEDREEAEAFVPQLKELVTVHYSKSKGRTLFMGGITGYSFFYAFEEAPISLSVEGEPTAETDLNSPGEAVLMVGKKRFPRIF